MNEQDNKNNTKTAVSNQDLAEAFARPGAEPEVAKEQKPKKHKDATESGEHSERKQCIIFSVIGGVGLVAGIAMLVAGLLMTPESKGGVSYPDLRPKEATEATYSALTGEVLADGANANAPAYCIQIPNGTDGARPQAGLNAAGVVFEAIAEAGITRFAAIYQDPSSAVIGPIRSLRIYYLQWDTPFDCTIVHAGGSGDALAAVSQGYKDLTEDYNYMYRGTYGGRAWNNLFTTATYLKKFSSDRGYDSSNIKGFARLKPEESEHARIDALAAEKLVITKAAKGNTSELKPAVNEVSLNLGGWSDFNVHYQYDTNSGKYLRSYASGAAHEVYNCPAEDLGERNPEDVCSLTQVAPSVVVAMMVNERKASDNYHEDIDAIGTGDAYVFQNGTAVKGTWIKGSKDEQITFADADGQEIRLAPGQTFVTAVPNYGSVDF